MTIHYSVKANALVPDTYYPSPVALKTRDLETLLRNVADETSLSPADVGSVVRSFIKEIHQGLSDGDRVSIDGLADFRVRLSQVLDSADGEFDPDSGGELRIAATIKPAITEELRRTAKFAKLVSGPKVPVPVEFFDVESGAKNQYTPGSIAELKGKLLKIADPDDPEQGLFFIAESDGVETRADVLQRNTNRKLVLRVPTTLSGDQRVVVRTRYTPGGEIRSAEMQKLITSA